MTRPKPDRYVLVARMRDGRNLFCTRLKVGMGNPDLTALRQQALVRPRDVIQEMQQRLHRVQAGGHSWQEVQFFDIVHASKTRPRKRSYQ
jgi:hypothetical protein